MKRTLIVFALVLAMLIQILPIAAFAQTETVEAEPVVTEPEVIEPEETEPEATEPEATEAEVTEPEATEPEATEAVEEAAEETAEQVQGGSVSAHNPLYPELEGYAPAASSSNEVEEEAPTAEAVWSFAEAGAEVREGLEARKGTITVVLKDYSTLTEPEFWNIWDYAFVETGVPTEGDYLKWHWTYVSASWSQSKSGSVYTITLTISVTYYTNASQEAALTKEVNKILNSFGFTAATTDYEKAYTIYNWVTTNIRYDYDGLDGYHPAHSAYNGIMYKKCVCQGYASIIYRMYLQVGIPVRSIGGDAYDVYPYIDPDEWGDNHCWNIAQINGKWYNLDATWDEGVSSSNWGWFLKCPNKFPDHSRWSEYNTSSFNRTYPMATSDFSPSVYNGILQVGGYWGYYVNGILQKNYTGPVNYNGAQFFVQNGFVDMNSVGLVNVGGVWRYVEYGVLKNHTGLVYFNDTWFYVYNGIVDFSYTGLVPYEGNYFYVQNNVLDWAYTGLGYHDGGWYFIQNGLLQLGYTGLVNFNGNWFYVQQGVLTFQYTGMVPYNGNMFYVQNSLLDWSYTGLGYHEGGWYFIQNALMQRNYTGFVEFNGEWFYVEQGVLTFGYTGLVYYNGNYFYVEASRIRWDYTGYIWYNGQNHYIENGVMRWY